VSFDWPIALAGLALLPILVALYLDRDRRRVASQSAFGNPDLIPNVVDRSPGRLRYLPPLTLLVALVFLVVGVARPHATVRVPREEATIILAIDVSRSMKANDVEPTRLDAARVAAKTFLDQVPDKFQVGVVSSVGLQGRLLVGDVFSGGDAGGHALVEAVGGHPGDPLSCPVGGSHAALTPASG